MHVPDNTERWRRMWSIFNDAIDCPDHQRRTHVEAACASDSALRDEVMALLTMHARTDGVLDQPPPVPAAATVPPASLEGRVIGRYVVERRIASGGTSVVYEALQRDPTKRVALKVMRFGLADRRAMRRFEFEAEILARLHHPSIAEVYQAGTFDHGEGAQPYFAMELVNGHSITEHARQRKTSVHDRVRLMIDVCEAVQHAHTRGVVHRDLKPSNILVDSGESDDGARVKVLDFGVAQLTGGDLSATQATFLSDVAGTIPYMSPEQVGGDSRSIDVRSDVYSLGVLSYELLCGRHPLEFSSPSLFDAIRVIREQQPRPLDLIDGALRGDLAAVVGKAMEKEPERRYPSAVEFATDLRRYLESEPVHARPTTRWYRLTRFTRRNRALVSAIAAAMLALAMGAAIATWQAVRATRAEAAANRRFEEVWQLALWMARDLDGVLRSAHGVTEARRAVVEKSTAVFSALRPEAAGNDALLRDIAGVSRSLAGMRGGPYTANEGDFAGSIANLTESIDILAGLRSRHPEDVALLAEQAAVVGERAVVFVAKGDFAAAADDVREALLLHGRRLDLGDCGGECRFLLTRTVGMLRPTLGEWPEQRAEEQLALRQMSLALMQRVHTASIDTTDVEEAKAAVGARFLTAQMLAELEQAPAADAMSREAMDMAAVFRERFSNDLSLRQSLGDMWRYRAMVLLAAGDLRGADAAFGTAENDYRTVIAGGSPRNDVLHIHGLVQQERAGVLLQMRRDADAWQLLLDAQQRFAEISAADPANGFNRSSLHRAVIAIAQLALDQPMENPRRCAWLRTALEITASAANAATPLDAHKTDHDAMLRVIQRLKDALAHCPL